MTTQIARGKRDIGMKQVRKEGYVYTISRETESSQQGSDRDQLERRET